MFEALLEDRGDRNERDDDRTTVDVRDDEHAQRIETDSQRSASER